MRFISRHPRYSFQAQAESVVLVAGPQGAVPVVSQQPIHVNFEHGGLSPWEEEMAVKAFHFAGLPDENQVPKTTRLSWFDTEAAAISRGWSEETRTFVEQRLLTSADYGQDFIAVDAPRKTPPFPKWDEFEDVNLLLQLVDQLGFDAEEARLYEYENQKRPQLLLELERRAAAAAAGGPTAVERDPEVVPA